MRQSVEQMFLLCVDEENYGGLELVFLDYLSTIAVTSLHVSVTYNFFSMQSFHATSALTFASVK